MLRGGTIISKGLTTAVYWRIKGNSDVGNDLNSETTLN